MCGLSEWLQWKWKRAKQSLGFWYRVMQNLRFAPMLIFTSENAIVFALFLWVAFKCLMLLIRHHLSLPLLIHKPTTSVPNMKIFSLFCAIIKSNDLVNTLQFISCSITSRMIKHYKIVKCYWYSSNSYIFLWKQFHKSICEKIGDKQNEYWEISLPIVLFTGILFCHFEEMIV